MDPNSLNDLLSNPETMNEMKNMMNDPNIMGQMNQMMSDPNMMTNIMNMMGGLGEASTPPRNNSNSSSEDNFDNEQNYQDKVGELDLNDLNELENVDIGQPIRKTEFVENDYVLIVNLKNKNYNNKPALILNYDKITNRYVVYLKELEKHLSIKEINLKHIYDAEDSDSDSDYSVSGNVNADDITCSDNYIEPQEESLCDTQSCLEARCNNETECPRE
jgi:hypothetical protein